jgi:hypothetical protein
MKKGLLYIGILLAIVAFTNHHKKDKHANEQYEFTLTPAKPIYFNSFVDCNMAEAWIGDTFRIFPGKYGEDPLWGYSNELKYADAISPDIVFGKKHTEFVEPIMPKNVKPNEEGLHGAVWFETIYQDAKDKSGKTLFALYHNENYPETYPYRSNNKKGYINKNWPQGLTGEKTPAAVCRIGIMKSLDGGKSWQNKGIVLEDDQPRMILKPYNNAVTFAGGVGDPSAIVSGNYLYIFYGEYGYPGNYDTLGYDGQKEYQGQCISIARIAIKDLENPAGKAFRWDGKSFTAPGDGIGKPIASLQIPINEGGGPASNVNSKFYWGPSVSWNNYLQSWVMLMAKSEGASWKGSSIYISFNKNKVLDEKTAQSWSKPTLLLNKPANIVWYPSLQPVGDKNAIKNKYTCLSMGKEARLFYKVQTKDTSYYVSEYTINFGK